VSFRAPPRIGSSLPGELAAVEAPKIIERAHHGVLVVGRHARAERFPAGGTKNLKVEQHSGHVRPERPDRIKRWGSTLHPGEREKARPCLSTLTSAASKEARPGTAWTRPERDQLEDPRSLATLHAVEAELTQDGYCYRYRPDERPLGESEGAFPLCGFFMALAYAQQGDAVGAARWFERNRAACGPPGLLAEEFDVEQRQLRGNLPQAFVHALMLECAGAQYDGTHED
jgi:hypothetical protein